MEATADEARAQVVRFKAVLSDRLKHHRNRVQRELEHFGFWLNAKANVGGRLGASRCAKQEAS